MYLAIPPQPDCATAWRAAAGAVDAATGRSAYNVIIDIADPVSGTGPDDPRVKVVDAFLQPFDKSVETALKRVRKVSGFPAGSSDQSRTYTIHFQPKSSQGNG